MFYVLNTASDGWSGGVGFVTPDMISKHFPKPADDVLIVRCGPPAMNRVMKEHMDTLGYSRDMQFEF